MPLGPYQNLGDNHVRCSLAARADDDDNDDDHDDDDITELQTDKKQ